MLLLKRTLKKLLIHSPLVYSERFDALLRLTLLKKWINKYKPFHQFINREMLYRYISSEIIGNKPISYLEFGVYKGYTLRLWADLNTNMESEFFGFDSFLGLQESWVNIGSTKPQKSFSTERVPPKIQDDRVKLILGWFQESLTPFLSEHEIHNPLIMHCDADLYTSTMFVLCKMDPFIVPGSIIIFDDFTSVLNDFRALNDYTSAFHRKYKVIGAAGPTKCEQVGIQILE